MNLWSRLCVSLCVLGGVPGCTSLYGGDRSANPQNCQNSGCPSGQVCGASGACQPLDMAGSPDLTPLPLPLPVTLSSIMDEPTADVNWSGIDLLSANEVWLAGADASQHVTVNRVRSNNNLIPDHIPVTFTGPVAGIGGPADGVTVVAQSGALAIFDATAASPMATLKNLGQGVLTLSGVALFTGGLGEPVLWGVGGQSITRFDFLNSNWAPTAFPYAASSAARVAVDGFQASDIYVVGQDGLMLHVDAFGLVTKVNTGVSVSLSAVATYGSERLAVVGDQSTLLRLSGTSVTQRTSVLNGARYNAVWVAAENDVWVVGDGGVIRRYYDNVNYTTVALPAAPLGDMAPPTPPNLRAIAGIVSKSGIQQVWIVGDNGLVLHGP